eukprot:Pgem_evm1s2266
MADTTTRAKLTTIVVQIVGQDTLRWYKLATDHMFLETMKNRRAKQNMVTAEDRIYVYQRMTTDDEMALLECLCDDGEACQCFDDIETNAKFVQQNLENELTAAGIINIFKDATLNSNNTHEYKRCAATGLSLIKASINNKVIHELPNLHTIAPHEIINTIKDKLGRKSMLKYVQALKAIMNTTKGNQSLQAYLSQLTQLQQTVEGHRPNAISTESNNKFVTILMSFAILYGCGPQYDKHTTNTETEFIKADDPGTINKLFHDIQEEFLNAEIKLEDKKS